MSKRRNEINSVIEFPDGERAEVDLDDFFCRIDALANMYGIGGCRSYSEFVHKMNEEDPVIINHLIKAANLRIRIQNGDKSVSTNYKGGRFIERKYVPSSSEPVFGHEKAKLVSFLADMGAPKEKINEAISDIKSGKIELPKYDYSWINEQTIRDEDIDWKDVWKKMQEDLNRGVNLTVSADSLTRRRADG